jgi:hypothetical protein
MIAYSTVKRLLKNIDISKYTGSDDIPGRILKECSDALFRPICRLFQKSYCLSYWPSLWKRSKVIPLHKTANQPRKEI